MLPSIIRSKLRWSRSLAGVPAGSGVFATFSFRIGLFSLESVGRFFLRRYFALFLQDSEQYRCRLPWPEGWNSAPHISQITFSTFHPLPRFTHLQPWGENGSAPEETLGGEGEGVPPWYGPVRS